MSYPAYKQKSIEDCIAVLKYIRDGVGGDTVIARFWGDVSRAGKKFSLSWSPSQCQGGVGAYTAITANGHATTKHPTASLCIALAFDAEVETVDADADFLSASGECNAITLPVAVAEALGLYDVGDKIGERE